MPKKPKVVNVELARAIAAGLEKKRRLTGDSNLSMRKWSISLFDREGYLGPVQRGWFTPDNEHLRIIAQDLGEDPEKWYRLVRRTTLPQVISSQEEQLRTIFNSLSPTDLQTWLEIGQTLVRNRNGR